MISLTFPDGSARDFKPGVTGRDVAESISKSLGKKAVAMTLDGKVKDLAEPIKADAQIRILTREDPEALALIRHDAAHVMAEAVQELYPGTQVTIGPVIDNGFYYDFARDRAVHARRSAGHRGQDARDHRARLALHLRGDGPRRGEEAVRQDGREVQARADRRHSPKGRRSRSTRNVNGSICAAGRI